MSYYWLKLVGSSLSTSYCHVSDFYRKKIWLDFKHKLKNRYIFCNTLLNRCTMWLWMWSKRVKEAFFLSSWLEQECHVSTVWLAMVLTKDRVVVTVTTFQSNKILRQNIINLCEACWCLMKLRTRGCVFQTGLHGLDFIVSSWPLTCPHKHAPPPPHQQGKN